MADWTTRRTLSSGPNSCPTTWLQSLQWYVQETDISTLDLSFSKIQIKDLISVLEFLADSQVIELNLTANNLKNGMESLSGLLIRTQIRKLKLILCRLSESDTLSLMKILSDSQITDLHLATTNFTLEDARSFIFYLTESHLTALNLRQFATFEHEEAAARYLFEALHSTSLTHLTLIDFLRHSKHSKGLLFLFETLKHTSITHLNLCGSNVGKCNLPLLGDSLRDSQLIELNLSENDIEDSSVDALFEALSGSKITTLNLSDNCFEGSNSLCQLLKKTRITKLDLSSNVLIKNAKMFDFPHFLTNSSVEWLNLNDCGLSNDIGEQLMRSLKDSKLTSLYVVRNEFDYKSLVQFAAIVKHTSITEFHFSPNFFSSSVDVADQTLIFFGEVIAGSKLKRIDICNVPDTEVDLLSFATFLEKLKNSSVSFLRLHFFFLDDIALEAISLSLVNTQVTHFYFTHCGIGFGIFNLASNLKSTAITHLDLTNSGIKDEGAKALAECLKETRIVDLNLSLNGITCHGATALALFLKDTAVFNLKLNENRIKDEGLEALAEHIQPNLITNLDVRQNPGNVLIVERVIWNNRRLVHKLVSSFKRIAPETVDNADQFENVVDSADIDEFLEECLNSYKLVIDQPSAASILAREESIMLSSDQISTFLLHKFPQKFSCFIASKIEADVSEHVKFLRKVEALGLRQIVELLLLNRPFYTIDESSGILHPFVYTLLKKYKIPICNLDVEPKGIERIIEYFTTFADIEGAAYVIRLLEGKNETTEKAEDPDGFSSDSNSTGSSNETGIPTERDKASRCFLL